MYGTFIFNLIYCRLPSSIAGREDFSTERGTFCFSIFIFLVSFHKEKIFQFYPFSLDTLTRSWATQTMLWLQTAGEMYHSGFRYDETITVFLFFFSKILVVIFILSLIFKRLLSLHLLVFILFFRLSLKTLKIFNLPCQIPCLDRFCKIYSQFLLLEPFPI
jgi:hypothetical protein